MRTSSLIVVALAAPAALAGLAALTACHLPRVETDPQCEQHQADIQAHVSRPTQPPAATFDGEWGNPKGGASWVIHQSAGRARIEAGDHVLSEVDGQMHYQVLETFNGTVDGNTLYYFYRGPNGASYGSLTKQGDQLAGPRWGECYLNRDFKLTRLR